MMGNEENSTTPPKIIFSFVPDIKDFRPKTFFQDKDDKEVKNIIDLADEYRVIECENNCFGALIQGKYHGEWTKPWVDTPLVIELLRRLNAAQEEVTYLKSQLKK